MALDLSKAFQFQQSESNARNVVAGATEGVSAAISSAFEDATSLITQLKNKEEAKQNAMTTMMSGVKVPDSAKMWGGDFGLSREVNQLLASEEFLEQMSATPEGKRQYSRLVADLEQFISNSQTFHTTTFGSGEVQPNQGNWLGSRLRKQSGDDPYKDAGRTDTRTEDDYQAAYATLNSEYHDAGSVAYDEGGIYFTENGQKKYLSEVSFSDEEGPRSINAFMPNLEKASFVSPLEYAATNNATLDFALGKKDKRYRLSEMTEKLTDVITRDLQQNPDEAYFKYAEENGMTLDQIKNGEGELADQARAAAISQYAEEAAAFAAENAYEAYEPPTGSDNSTESNVQPFNPVDSGQVGGEAGAVSMAASRGGVDRVGVSGLNIHNTPADDGTRTVTPNSGGGFERVIMVNKSGRPHFYAAVVYNNEVYYMPFEEGSPALSGIGNTFMQPYDAVNVGQLLITLRKQFGYGSIEQLKDKLYEHFENSAL